jgi:cytochrome c oxidase subunit 4
MVGGILLVLTCVTVLISRFQLGQWNLIVAMAVASVKATLVLLFFMHLKYDDKVYTLAMLISVALLAVFITFTMIDTMGRDEFGRGSIDKQVPYRVAPVHPAGATEGHGEMPVEPAAGADRHTAESVNAQTRK